MNLINLYYKGKSLINSEVKSGLLPIESLQNSLNIVKTNFLRQRQLGEAKEKLSTENFYRNLEFLRLKRLIVWVL
jgi:hypothetical protein